MEQKKAYNLIFAVAATCIVGGAILYEVFKDVAPYVFAVGAVLVLFIRIKTLYRGDDPRLRRLGRISFIGTLLYLLTAYLMYTQSMYWVMCLAICAGIELIVAIRT